MLEPFGKINKNAFKSNNHVKELKKGFTALGLVLLIVGFILTLWATTYRSEVILSNYTHEKQDEWEISYDFEVGNRLIFEVVPGENWDWYAEPKYFGGPFPFDNLPVTAAIIAPNGVATNITMVWAVGESTGITRPLIFFGGTPTSQVEGLTMEEKNWMVEGNGSIYYNPVGAIVKNNGTYKAVVLEQWLPSPPRYVRLVKQRIAFELPYLYVTPIGVVVMGIGVILPVWAGRKPKHRVRQINKK